MKKSALSEYSESKGFTLVELLVVISIIAVLSVIGITIFSGVQKAARDSRRRADIDAIAKALEVNRAETSYVGLEGSKFAGGSVPIDSGNTNTNSSTNTYCVYSRTDSTAITGPAAPWAAATCPTVDGASANSITSTAVPLTGAGVTNWTVCASLENTSATYCKSSSQ